MRRWGTKLVQSFVALICSIGYPPPLHSFCIEPWLSRLKGPGKNRTTRSYSREETKTTCFSFLLVATSWLTTRNGTICLSARVVPPKSLIMIWSSRSVSTKDAAAVNFRMGAPCWSVKFWWLCSVQGKGLLLLQFSLNKWCRSCFVPIGTFDFQVCVPRLKINAVWCLVLNSNEFSPWTSNVKPPSMMRLLEKQNIDAPDRRRSRCISQSMGDQCFGRVTGEMMLMRNVGCNERKWKDKNMLPEISN